MPCNIDKITNSTQEKIQLISRIAISILGGLPVAYIVVWIVCKLPQVAQVFIYLIFLITYFKIWGKHDKKNK